MIIGVFKDWAQFLEVLGVWLAAIATFTAAFIALKVANRSNQQIVKVNARPMVTLTPGERNSKQDVFHVTATNRGIRPVTINGIEIKSKLPRYNAVLIQSLPNSSPLPASLNDGETGNWIYPEVTADGGNFYRGFAEHFIEYNRLSQWLLVRNLRFYVFTSLGGEFVAPPSNGLRKKLTEQLLEVKKEI